MSAKSVTSLPLRTVPSAQAGTRGQIKKNVSRYGAGFFRYLISTLIPFVTILLSRAMSQFSERMQPWLAQVPML